MYCNSNMRLRISLYCSLIIDKEDNIIYFFQIIMFKLLNAQNELKIN